MEKIIMVIDDSQTNLILVRSIIDELGEAYKTIIEDKSRVAFKRIKKVQPDVVVLDIMMPDVDGISILRQMKSDIELSHIPVILLTAILDLKVEKEAINLGASCYLRKPLDQKILLSKIQALCNQPV